MASLNDDVVKQLLQDRRIASFASENSDGSIHVVSVWYWFNDPHVYIATGSRTRKARNLQVKSKASLMIDSRDPAASYGATIAGMARIVKGDESRKLNLEIHRKYMSAAALADPRVGPVFAAWDDMTIEITPISIFTWDMRVADQQAFGGAIASNPSYLLPLQR
jgi:nitroimidazol reductase NimA-like FMN-containing flavoprotein (pyridoxamine 5'-phosphate oxidase superfamily)